MRITNATQLDAIMRDAGEIQDGLFLFAQQGALLYDTAAYVAADGKPYWIVETYRYAGEGSPDYCNASHLPGFDYTEYTRVGCCAYTQQSEMHQHLLRAIQENHY